jgi:hypothetical protein
MKWTPVESSTFQAAAYAERGALLYFAVPQRRGLSLFRGSPVAVSRVSGGGFQRPILWAQHSRALPV